MEEEDDDDEWWSQRFYLDVINRACEPIGGELSGQFPGTARASTDLFFFFFFCCLGVFVFCVCLSVRALPGPARTFFFFWVFFSVSIKLFSNAKGGGPGWLEWRSHGLLSLVIMNVKKISCYLQDLKTGIIMDVKTNNYLQDLYACIAYLK